MTYKTIAVSLNEIDALPSILAAAALLGRTFQAHMQGVYIIPAVQVYPSGGIDIMPQVYEGARQYFTEKKAATRQRFEDAMRKEGLSYGYDEIDSASMMISDDLIARGLTADLILIQPPKPGDASWVEPDIAERVVMGCGRPVLILPFAPKRAFGFGDAMVAWNASREAARAAFEALPLLRASSSVRVVAVDPQADPKMRGAIAGADMAEALARHGVKAVAEPYYGGGAEAGHALLQHAREMDASLLVLGGYGHSRLREWILGGATRDVLASLEVPVLMSH